MNTKIFCVFAGLGKTFLSQKYPNVIDHDVTKFKYKYNNHDENINYEALKATNNRVKNQDFPTNWLIKLKELMNTDNILLVPADLEIRNILVKNKIDFIFIMPDLNSKKILIDRYKKRGNNEKFIERAVNQLQEWHKEIPYSEYNTIILPYPFFLETWLIQQKIL